MSIRRCKKRTNLVNDARIKSCIARYDSGAYTRVQFLSAVSHSDVGAHAVPAAATDASDTDDDDDQDVNGSNQLQSLRHFFTLWLSILTFSAFSTPANWSRIFMSRNFQPCKLVPQIHVSHFQSPHLLLFSCASCIVLKLKGTVFF